MACLWLPLQDKALLLPRTQTGKLYQTLSRRWKKRVCFFLPELCLSCLMFTCLIIPPTLSTNAEFLLQSFHPGWCEQGISSNNPVMSIGRLSVDSDSQEVPDVTLASSRKTVWAGVSSPLWLSGQVSSSFGGRTHERWKQRFSSSQYWCCCCLHAVVSGVGVTHRMLGSLTLTT